MKLFLNHKHVWALSGVFLLALFLRTAAVMFLGSPPTKDGLQYHQIAMNVLAGNGISLDSVSPTSIRPPAYPVFLATIYAIFGQDYRNALYVQALLHALLIFPLFGLACAITRNSGAGWLAAGFYSLHPSLEVVSFLHAENLLIVLGLCFVMAVYFMLQAPWNRRSGWLATTAGLCTGLMGLTKPEFSFLGAALFAVGWFWPGLKPFRCGLALVFGISLIWVGGWQLRNVMVKASGEASIPQYTLLYAYYPAFSGKWWWPVMDMEALEREREESRNFFATRLDTQALRKELFRLVGENPIQFMQLIVSRVLILWFSPPVGSSVLGKISPVMKHLILFFSDILVLMAFSKMIVLVRRRPAAFAFLLPALYMTAVYALVHAIRRYGYPFVPILCLQAAMMIRAAARRLRLKSCGQS